MCIFCFENSGLSQVAAYLRGERLVYDPFAMSLLVQEGVVDGLSSHEASLSPVSGWCRATEATLMAGGRVTLPPPVTSEVLGPWQPPACLSEADAGSVAGALEVLHRYTNWARQRAAARAALPLLTANRPEVCQPDADLFDGFFPVLWMAWLLAVARAPAPALAEVAEKIATSPLTLTGQEMLSMFLERRAAVALYDAGGMAPILAAYGERLRPAAAHYVAVRRRLAAADLAALRRGAERCGEDGNLGDLLG